MPFAVLSPLPQTSFSLKFASSKLAANGNSIKSIKLRFPVRDVRDVRNIRRGVVLFEMFFIKLNARPVNIVELSYTSFKRLRSAPGNRQNCF